MPDVKANEREFASQVISWLNEAISQGSYPFEAASGEVSLKISEKKTNFPDVQIWLNREAGMGFCGWELKTPETPVDDAELLENAATKARAMNADYFVTWNMRDAVIWRTPSWIDSVSFEHRLKTYPAISAVSRPDDLWVASKQSLLRDRAREILYDLSLLHKEKHLHLADIDATFFVHILTETAKKLTPVFRDAITGRIGSDKAFKKALFDWAVQQAIPNYDDPVFYESVARQRVYRLLGRILFYLTLCRFRADMPTLRLDRKKPSDADSQLRGFFERARQVDFQAVFEQDFTDSIAVPPQAVECLAALIHDLDRFNFASMPQEVVGTVYEKLIPPAERHVLGQYFTPENLVDLINAFCIQTKDCSVIDPTCGTGTFLVRAYDRLRALGEKSHTVLLSKLWGIDIAHFPAELATINLFRQNLSDYRNFPRIVTKDVFDIGPGDKFPFPPPKAVAGGPPTIELGLPVFDAMVGNFPYIRQELISKRIRGYKSKLAAILQGAWKTEFSEWNGKIELSGQADIYAYLFFHTARFVKADGGRIGIVTSNSWLDVGYGYQLQRFFLKYFKIVAIIESRCEPWFEDAAINTVVTILERISRSARARAEIDRHHVKFVKLKKRLRELVPQDMKLESQTRWTNLDGIVNRIESAGSEHYDLKTGKSTLQGSATYDSEDFRIRVLRQGELLENLESAKKTAKWGKYLRAPDVCFQLLRRCGDRLRPLRNVADVRFGIKTGINEFFYLNDDKIDHWGIETAYCAPVIRSPREAKGIIVRKSQVPYKVFLCHDSAQSLRKKRSPGALRYIQWGAKQQTKAGTKWPDVSTVAQREFWYDLGKREPGPILLQMITGDRFFAIDNADGVYVDHNLFELFPHNKSAGPGLTLYLNSTLAALFREVISRVNLGEGATKTEGVDWKELPVPDEATLRVLGKKSALLTALEKRAVRSIFEEVKDKDRQKLDAFVLDTLGLDPSKDLQPLYEGICDLVRERMDLAAMRKTIKKVKTQKDTEKLKEQVIGDVIPSGPRQFPEDFVDRKHLRDSQEIPVPAERLKLGGFFLGQQEVVTDQGFKYNANSVEEAKFLVYSHRANVHIARVPRDPIVLVKSVDQYERYVRTTKDQLFEDLFGRTHDHRLAHALAEQICDEMGLPQV